MATYKYDLVGGKIRVQKGTEARNFFPFHELVRIVGTETYVGVIFVNSTYSFNIDAAVDTVILAGVTIAPGSQTNAQLADTLSASSVFQKASTAPGGNVSADQVAETSTRKFVTPAMYDFIQSLMNSGN